MNKKLILPLGILFLVVLTVTLIATTLAYAEAHPVTNLRTTISQSAPARSSESLPDCKNNSPYPSPYPYPYPEPYDCDYFPLILNLTKMLESVLGE
jgi:hypothetical protein